MNLKAVFPVPVCFHSNKQLARTTPPDKIWTILETCKTYHYLTSISWRQALFVLLLMEPDINPTDAQLDMITEILIIENVSCNWKSPQYERKTCKQINVGVVQILIKKDV